MGASWDDVRAWSSDGLEDAARTLRSAQEDLIEIGTDLAPVTFFPWSGQAAQLARLELAGLKEVIEDRIAEIAAARKALLDASDIVLKVEKAVTAAEAFAAYNGLQITDLRVRDVTGLPDLYPSEQEARDARDQREQLIEECAELAGKAVSLAAEADETLENVIKAQILSGVLSALDHRSPAEAARRACELQNTQPPGNATPAEIKAWWDSKTAAQQNAIIIGHPEWINNLDGVPATVLDQVNTALIPVYQERVTTRRDALTQLLAAMGPDDIRRAPLEKQLQEQNDKLASLANVQRMADRPNTMVLGLDISKERTEAIISSGNPDTADHVGVFTPGLSSNVQSMGSYVDSMRKIKTEAEKYLLRSGSGGNTAVAMVTWLGYQSPQLTADSLTDLDGTSVGMPVSATQGGDDLARFYTGISTKNENVDLTALGHSYGSTTTGLALHHEGTGVDRVAFYGSPGVGAGDVDDLQVGAGKVFYAEGKWDGIGDLERFGHDLSTMKDVHQMSARDANVPGEGVLRESIGHSDYFSDDTTSQYNTKVLVAGDEEAVVNAPLTYPLGEIIQDQVTSLGHPEIPLAKRALQDLEDSVASGVEMVRSGEAADLARAEGRKVLNETLEAAATVVEKSAELGTAVNEKTDDFFDQLERAAEDYQGFGQIPR